MKQISVTSEHECEILANQKTTQLAVQQFNSEGWYLVDYKLKHPQAGGIKFCPYCGKELHRQLNLNK